MNTIEKINVIELASELAHRKLIKYVRKNTDKFPYGYQLIGEDGVTYYTDEAQDLFNEYYDNYLTLIETCKE